MILKYIMYQLQFFYEFSLCYCFKMFLDRRRQILSPNDQYSDKDCDHDNIDV